MPSGGRAAGTLTGRRGASTVTLQRRAKVPSYWAEQWLHEGGGLSLFSYYFTQIINNKFMKIINFTNLVTILPK